MSKILALDTSNYTTSACVVDTQAGIVWEKRIMVCVENGKCGIRQNDAVFCHIKNLNSIFEGIPYFKFDCTCASSCPSERENSYMPCFTVGVSFAKSVALLNNIPLYLYSHQKNHIMAAIVSANAEHLLNSEFIAYHISGGTTDIVLCKPNGSNFDVQKISGTADISCGQLIDRTGTMLGMPFPSGRYVENAADGHINGKIKISEHNGLYNFSGFQNIAEKMFKENHETSQICDFVLDVVFSFVLISVSKIRKVYGDLPVLMSGGVMSNGLLRKQLTDACTDIYFADPHYSSDNAMGTAWLSAAERGEFSAGK